MLAALYLRALCSALARGVLNTVLQPLAPGGIAVGITTQLRNLTIGEEFKLFNYYKDGTPRPRLKWKPRGPSFVIGDGYLGRAHIRLNRHAIGQAAVEIEIRRPGPNLNDTLRVVEHRRGHVTIVADRKGRTAPLWSGIRLQQRNGRNGHGRR